jgi:hypothetical protein
VLIPLPPLNTLWGISRVETVTSNNILNALKK